MEQDTRINQFKQMAEADPENELGHFSLGKAYLDAGRADEAIASLQRTIDLNPRMSKAYHLLGEAHRKSGQTEEAVRIWSRGVHVADQQGDRVPREAMAVALRELGAEVPAAPAGSSAAVAGSATASATGFSCSRCGRPEGKLDKPPMKGPLGQKVFENVCRSCWKEWIGMGTKVINELALVLANPQSQEVWDQHMVEFLQLDAR